MKLKNFFELKKKKNKHKKIKIEYNTLNELLNCLDVDGKKLDAYIKQWFSLDETISILLWKDCYLKDILK